MFRHPLTACFPSRQFSLGFTFAVLFGVFLAVPAAAAFPAVQEVRVTVVYQKSNPDRTKLVFEDPYSYTVSVDPWNFYIHYADVNKNPSGVAWIVTDDQDNALDFIIEFDEETHFGAKRLFSGDFDRSLEDVSEDALERSRGFRKGGAESGALTMHSNSRVVSGSDESRGSIDGMYGYSIKIFLPLAPSDHPREGERDPKRNFILIDPNYVVED